MENLIKPTIKFALALCEILVYGNEENRDKMKMMLNKLQHQINKSKTNKNKVRILWYMGEENQTIEKKKEWLINESNCIFYVFAPDTYKIPDNYIANLMIGVNLFDKSLGLMRKEGIVMKKKKKEKEQTHDYQPFEILE